MAAQETLNLAGISSNLMRSTNMISIKPIENSLSKWCAAHIDDQHSENIAYYMIRFSADDQTGTIIRLCENCLDQLDNAIQKVRKG